MANALITARDRRGNERGVTGKELRFQQNKHFGPGAFVPYPHATTGQAGVQSYREAMARQRSRSGVYRTRFAPIRTVRA